MLLLDLLNLNLVPQLLVLKTPKWLGEDVPELSSSLDILKLDASSIDTVTDEMVLGVDVLAAVVEDRILCQCNGGLVVHQKNRRAELFSSELPQQSLQPNPLVAAAMYSASQVDRATTFCLWDC
jgi:hypothetical protein